MTTLTNRIKQSVRKHANNRCEYCLKPSLVCDVNHQIDHIISKRHKGSDELDNLALACFECNNAKGADVGAYDPITNLLMPFYNPRRQNWNDHFELIDYIIIGKTPNGRATVEFLNINTQEQISVRRDLIMAGNW